MPDYSGKLIAFLNASDLVIGLTTSHSGSKLQVTDLNGKQHRVNEKYVLTAFDKSSADLNSLSEVGGTLTRRIHELRDNVDTELLWEFVRDLPGDSDLKVFCDNYFGEAQPLHQAAMYLAVGSDPVRFKIKGQQVQPRSAEQVAEQQHALARQQERQSAREQGMTWLKQALSGNADPDSKQGMIFLRRLEDFLFRQHDDGIGALLEELDNQAPAREVAFDILNRLGRVPEDVDPLLIISGIEKEFTPELLAAAEAIAPYQAEAHRTDYCGAITFSIDDPETREVDDAISVETDEESICVSIHIADVAHFLQKDDVLDREARRRSATIYLPTETITMLPERISCDLASLHQGVVRPSVSYRAVFTHAGELREWRIERGQVCVTHRLSYDEADALLEQRGGEAPAGELQQLRGVATALWRARRERGAITINKPEMKVRVNESGTINVKMLSGDSPSRLIISELMILANRLTAEFSTREKLPLIYRAQDPPEVSFDLPEVYDPVAIDEVFRHIKRGRLSVHAQYHAALGLEAYTQASSPLRRFTDLVIQRQIAAQLNRQRPPYEGDQLLAVLGAVEAAEQDNRGYERQAVRFQLLRYIEQLPAATPLAATVVRSVPGGFTVELTDFVLRARLWDNRNHPIGTRLDVKVHEVTPRDGNLVVKPA